MGWNQAQTDPGALPFYLLEADALPAGEVTRKRLESLQERRKGRNRRSSSCLRLTLLTGTNPSLKFAPPIPCSGRTSSLWIGSGFMCMHIVCTIRDYIKVIIICALRTSKFIISMITMYLCDKLSILRCGYPKEKSSTRAASGEDARLI